MQVKSSPGKAGEAMWWYKLIANTVCRIFGHGFATDGDGYVFCPVCQQSLDYETHKALGWLGYNYHPGG
jgi:hypothetical protein